MNELKTNIHDEANGLDYVLVGDYYIPAIEPPEGDDRPIGKWGRMHRAYLEETNPLLLNHLILTGRLHIYLADLDEQAIIASFVMIRSKAVADAGNGFDVTGICYVRFNGFPQESHGAGNASVVAALHLPGVFTNLLRGQYNLRVTHEVQ